MKIICNSFIWLACLIFYYFPSAAQQGACIQVGDTSYESGKALIQTRDGGYAVIGHAGYDWRDNYFLAKLDSNAVLQWSITISDSGHGEVRDIIQTTDGGFAFTGDTQGAFQMQDQDVFIIKLDSTGNLEWAKTIGEYGYQKHEQGHAIVQCNDGGYAIAGWTESFSFQNNTADYYLIKLDKFGNLQWTRTIGDSSTDYGYSIIQTPDGSFIIGGIGAYVDSVGNQKGAPYIVKLNNVGSLIWSKYFLGNYDRDALAMIHTSDNGFALTGLTYGVFGQPDVLAMKLDSGGNVQWSRVIGEEHWQEGFSIIESRDGGFVIAGLSHEFSVAYPDMLLFKLDAQGNMEWLRTAGFHLGNPWDLSVAYDIIQNKKGEFIMTGSGNTFDGDTLYGGGMSIVKITEDGELCCKFWTNSEIVNDTPVVVVGTGVMVDSGGTVRNLSVSIARGGKVQKICGSFTTTLDNEEPKAVQKEPLISPNPSQGHFTLYSPFPVSDVVAYNVLGEKIPVESFNKTGKTGHGNESFYFQLSLLPPGVYFLEIQCQPENHEPFMKSYYQKLVIIK